MKEEEEEEKIRKENEVIEDNNKQYENIQRAARKERLAY